MRKKTSTTLVMLVALAACGATTAQAKTSHHYTSTIMLAPVATAQGYPAVGGIAVNAGTWATSLWGDGAVVDQIMITGQPAPGTFAFQGTETGFVALGTFRDKFTGTATVNPDGTQTVVSKGRITGGTGAYRGAKGSFTFSGSTAAGSSVVDGHSSGTVSY
jgi:hypothetical protein